MATACGGTLALMDAGVRIRQPVAGIAMGLIKEGDEVCILSDILGSEDHHGDLDFKVAGTGEGITALQMDMKVTGIDRSILETALAQAKEGRLHILREMLQEMRHPRPEISPLAPKILRTRINPEKIGLVIGHGGKMIKGIQEETGAKVDIEDDGTVTVWGTDAESAEGAMRKIELLTEDVQVDRIYKGRVVSIKDWGAFVEVLPGQEGLLHVSELGAGFVKKVSDAVSYGDEIEVKVIDIDPQGRIRLSRRAVLEERGLLEKEPEENREQARSREGGDRSRDRGRRGPPSGGRGDSRGPRRGPPGREGDRRR